MGKSTGLQVGDEEGVGGAAGAFVDLGGDELDGEAGFAEAGEELVVGACGPEDGASAGLEGGLDGLEAWGGVELEVACGDEGDGAVVDVEGEGVVGGGRGLADEGGDVGFADEGAGVVEGGAVEGLEALAVPGDDGGDDFGDFDDGVGREEVEGFAEGEAEAEAADEHADAGPGGVAFDGELAEQLFGGGCFGVHELLAAEADGVGAVVLVEGDGAAVRGGGFGELEAWFHGRAAGGRLRIADCELRIADFEGSGRGSRLVLFIS